MPNLKLIRLLSLFIFCTFIAVVVVMVLSYCQCWCDWCCNECNKKFSSNLPSTCGYATCRNIFKYIEVEQREKSNRNWNVLTQPHLFLHFQMNFQIHTVHTQALTQIYCFPTSQRVWIECQAVNQNSRRACVTYSLCRKNRHQILVH